MPQRSPDLNKILPIAVAILGAVGGYFLSQKTADKGDPAISDTVEAQKLTALSASKRRKELAGDSTEIEAASDAASLVRMLENFADGSTRSEINREMIFSRLAVVDPQAAVDLLAEDRATLMKLLIEWAMIDPPAVAQRLIADEKRNWLSDLGKALALRAPEKSVELMSIGLESENRYYSWANVAFASLYEQNPEQALSLAESLNGKRKALALEGIASAMAREDPTEAIKWAGAISDAEQRTAAIAAVAVEMVRKDPDATAQLLKEWDNPFERNMPGREILRDLVRKDPDMALAWVARHFKEVPAVEWKDTLIGTSLRLFGEERTVGVLAKADDDLRAHLFRAIAYETRSYDVTKMMAGLERIGSSEIRSELRDILLPRLAADDFTLAMEHIDSLPEDEVSAELWKEIVKDGTEHGFLGHEESVWRAIAHLPEKEQTPYLRGQLRNQALSDATAAKELLNDYREHPGYLDMVNGVARGLVAADTESAKTWIEGLDDDARAEAAKAFAASKMGDGGVPEIYDWLVSLDVPEQTLSAATGWLIHRWAGTDGIGASEFIIDMPPGKVRQSAIDGLIWENHRLDPEAALKWVAELQKEERRAYWNQRIEKFLQQTERIGDR